MEARLFLQDLALVLCVAAVTTVVFRRLRQPVVLGYLLAGMIVGPHIPIPLFADLERVHTLSELGVILVMFSIGLEFSIRRLIRVFPSVGLTGTVQIGLMISIGYLVGQSLGWSGRESLFAGAMVAISSTMIVAKVFADEQVSKRVTDVVYGVLVVQDMAAVLLLALLTAIASGAGLTGGDLARTAGKLVLFLAAMVAGGFVIVPRAIRVVARLRSPETLLVASVGLCFALSLLAHELGYSVALGAFVAGSLVAESGEGHQVEQLVSPVRDVFAAVFFVSVGMIVDPHMIVDHWPAVLALTGVVVIGQTVSVSLGAFLSGNDIRTSIQAGMSLAQIGEFSFIIASTGVALGAVGEFLYPVAVAVALATAFATPWLIRGSARVALLVDRRLPKRMQTFVALYATWLKRPHRNRSRRARLVRLMIVDFGVIAAIIVIAGAWGDQLQAAVIERTSVPGWAARALVAGAAFLFAAPFFVGMVRCARALGRVMAMDTLPRRAGQADLAAAPRRALTVTIQLALVLLLAIPLLALTRPLVPLAYSAIVIGLALAVAGVSFWRSAENLQDHVRAVAQVVVEALASQASADQPTLDEVQKLLPGLGDLTPIELTAGSLSIGKTLAELDLRGMTGATAIAIYRAQGEVLIPTGKELLLEGDVLALAGTTTAVDAARQLLTGGDAQH